jgi:hypothetical protein
MDYCDKQRTPQESTSKEHTSPVRNLVNNLAKLDTRLIVIGVIMLSSVFFALYKMSGAFSGQEEAPAYRNQPAKAFVPPASQALVESQYMESNRLPDDDYVAVADKSRPLLRPVSNLTITQSALKAAGMTDSQAAAAASTFNEQKIVIQGRDVSVSPTLQVAPGDSSTAQVNATARYSSAQNGSPPLTATIRFGYYRSNGKWLLDSALLSIDDNTTFADPGTDSGGVTDDPTVDSASTDAIE